MRNFAQCIWAAIGLAVLFGSLVYLCLERGRTIGLEEARAQRFQQEQEIRITDDAHCAYCESYGHVSPAPARADRLVKLYGRILHDSSRLLGDVRNALNQDNEMDDTIRGLLVFSQLAIQEIRSCAYQRKAQLQGTNVVFNISNVQLCATESFIPTNNVRLDAKWD